MADPILAFRTITTCRIHRLDSVGGVLTPTPIAIPINPNSAVINPGIAQEKIKQTNVKGEMQTVLTYISETDPTIDLEFGLGTPDIDGLLIGRIPEADTAVDGFVNFEFVANKTEFDAKASGEWGYSVATQVAATSKAQVWYIDPLTKLAVPLTIVDSAPAAMNEIQIEASLAITIHADLAETGYNVYGYVPATYANATKQGGSVALLFSVYLAGVGFDENAVIFTCARASLLYGDSIKKEPTRSPKFQIVPSGLDSTGLGYDIIYLREKVTI